MNTRLVGFSIPGDSNPHIRLERFGVKEDVYLPEDVLRALRNACFNILPRASRETQGDIVADGFRVGTSSVCTVKVALSSEAAFVLSKALSSLEKERSVLSEEEIEKLQRMGELLKKSAEVVKEDWESLR